MLFLFAAIKNYELTEHSDYTAGILLVNGLTDGLWRASVLAEFLESKNIHSYLAVNKAFMKRNDLNLSLMRSGLGFSDLVDVDKILASDRVIIQIDEFLQLVREKRLISGKKYIINPRFLPYRKWVQKFTDLPALKSGDVEARNPYCEKISSQIKSGYIYESYERPIAGQLYLHCRLGDIAILSGRDLRKVFGIGKEYLDKIFSTSAGKFLSYSEFSEYYRLDGKRGVLSRYLPMSIYSSFVAKMHREFESIVLSTDGYYRAAIALRKQGILDLSISEIETSLNNYFFSGMEKNFIQVISGENCFAFKESLVACAQSQYWQKGASSFPFDLFVRSGMERPFVSPPLNKQYSWSKDLFSEEHFAHLLLSFEESQKVIP